MNNLILLLGGNIGNVTDTFTRVKQDIYNRIGRIEKESEIYLTPPLGFESKHKFLNQGLKVLTLFDVNKVLEITQIIEDSFGKKNNLKNGYKDRPIDIDIIFFNQDLVKNKNIIVPHMHMHKRSFVLVPLCDIIPDYIHPVFKTSVVDLSKKVNKNNISKYVI